MSHSAVSPVPGTAPNGSVIELDIRGQICPSALLIALREVNDRKQELKAGAARLRLRTDNRDSTITIPDALSNMGYSVEVSKQEGHYLVEIRGRGRQV